MNNVVSVDKIAVSASTLTAHITLMRGINCAARQDSVPYTLQLSFSYPAAGAIVTTPVTSMLLTATKPLEGTNHVWQDFSVPAIAVAAAPDAGAQITCNAKITITDSNNNTVDCGFLDTAVLTPS